MEKQPIKDCGRLSLRLCMVLSILRVIYSHFWINILSWENDREVGLNFNPFWKREDREFQELMRVQVGTRFSHIYSSNKMEFFQNIYWDWYYHPLYSKEEAKIWTIPVPEWHQFLKKLTPCHILSLLREWTQVLVP